MKPVALVTGGSRGIGAAICRLGGRDGYDVAVNYAGRADAAEAVAADIRAADFGHALLAHGLKRIRHRQLRAGTAGAVIGAEAQNHGLFAFVDEINAGREPADHGQGAKQRKTILGRAAAGAAVLCVPRELGVVTSHTTDPDTPGAPDDPVAPVTPDAPDAPEAPAAAVVVDS